MRANQGNGQQPLAGWQIALIATVAYLLLTGCGSESPAVTSRFTAFGEIVDLSLVQVKPDKAERVIRLIREELEALEQDLNTWADGQMARVNKLLPTGEAFEAPVGILPLIHLSQRYADLSDNRFNPAYGKLSALWGFNVAVPEGMQPPPSHAIEQLLEADARMSDVEVDILTLKGHNPALRLDFSGINQAYAIDLAVARLREQKIRHAQIKTGSDLRAIGNRSGQPWRVPIRRGSGAGVLAILDIQGDESVVTRAVHDRNWLHEGVLYHSILDPRTGRPVRHTQSVTVVHPEAAVAAAAANALFVAGPEQWHALARTLGIHYALLIDSEGTVHLNPELYDRIELIDDDIPFNISPPLSPRVAS